jgi:prepilin-type N-terminal cleavage/methylation domain-containing protein
MTSPSNHPDHRRPLSGFTLIELLVVIAIIAILAGLGFAGMSGAMRTARKSEVRAIMNQTKLAVISYYADYGVYPTNSGKTDAAFLRTMMGSNPVLNKRGIRYLEPSASFTNANGLVAPKRLYPAGTAQSNFTLVVDTNYDGVIEVVNADTGAKTNISGSVALYLKDPDKTTGYITTY